MLDVRYINPFLTASRLVLHTVAKMSVSMGKLSVKKPGAPLDKDYCVAVTIALKGTATGLVAMRFTAPVVFGLVKALTGESPTKLDADCLDAMAEFANMVVGNAKREFPGGGVTISTPKVLLTDPLTQPPVLVMPFDCDAGRFLIETRLVTTAPPPEAPAPPVDAALNAKADKIVKETIGAPPAAGRSRTTQARQ